MLSVVITAWNEEKNLPRVIASVDGLADEIIVVDTQSTDNTSAVAKKLGCRVFSHKYTGIVEPVRNFSIQKAKGDWILILDADEEVSDKLKKHIKMVMLENKADYYRIPRYNLIFGKWITSAHWWPDYVYRLFKRGFVVWDETIHSIPSTRGIGADFPIDPQFAITHHHYETIFQYLDRINRYTDYQLDSLQRSGVVFHWRELIRKPSQEFLNQFFARSGYKDGLHGFALALLQSFSELVLYLKFWQKDGFTETKLELPELLNYFRTEIRQFYWWYYESLISQSSLPNRFRLKVLKKIHTLNFQIPAPIVFAFNIFNPKKKGQK